MRHVIRCSRQLAIALVLGLMATSVAGVPALASDSLVIDARTSGDDPVTPVTHTVGELGYEIYVFETDGTFDVVSGTGEIDYVVVGGGGGGGSHRFSGGGGGGGQVQTGAAEVGASSTFDIAIGAGGAGGAGTGSSGVRGDSGESTTLLAATDLEVTSRGGGGGGGGTSPHGDGGGSVATGGGGAATLGESTGSGGSGALTAGADGASGVGGGGGGAAGSAEGRNGGDGVDLAGLVGVIGGADGIFGAGGNAGIFDTAGSHGPTATGAGGAGSGSQSHPGGNGSDGVVLIRVAVDTPVFAAASPPSGAVGAAYDYTFEAAGVDSWSISGDTPPGLTFDDGQLAGTPTDAGDYTFTVTASNVHGSRHADATVSIVGLPATIEAVTATEIAGTVDATVASPTVRVEDAGGEPLADVAVAFAASGTSSLEGGTTATTNSDGEATSPTWRLGTAVGAYTLTATVQGDVDPDVDGELSLTFTATAAAGAAAALAIVVQPGDTANTTAFDPAPAVRLVDTYGNQVETPDVPIAATVSEGDGVLGDDDPDGPTITRLTGVDGVAVFDGAAVTGVAGTYRLAFTSAGLTGATSAELQLSAGSPDRFTLDLDPTSVAAGEAIAATAQLVDVSGNPVPTVVGGVDWAADAAGTFDPADAATDAQGQARATFTPTAAGDLQIGVSAGALVGDATASVSPGAAANLALTRDAAGFASGTAFTTQPALARQDAYGNVVTTDPQQSVTATVTGDGCVLEGTTTAGMIDGIATFTDLGISGSTAQDCVVTFSAGALTATQTVRPTVGSATQLLISAAPSTSASSGAPLAQQPVIQVADSGGNPVTSEAVTVTASFDAELDHVVDGEVTTTDAAGTATFTELVLAGQIGSYALTFSAPGLGTVAAADLVLTAGAAEALVITTQPAGGRSGQQLATQPVIAIHDAWGNLVLPDDTTEVTVALASGDEGDLDGTTTVTADGGIATFGDLVLTGVVDEDYVLSFTAEPTLTVATSAAIQVEAGDAAALRVTTPPAGGRAGGALAQQPQVEVIDTLGNRVVVDDTTVVTVTLVDADTGELGGTTSVTVDAGLATFDDLTLGGPIAATYVLTFAAADLTSTVSDELTLTHGDAAAMTLTVPGDGTNGDGRPLQTQPVLEVTDAWGNPVVDDPHQVTATVDDEDATLTGETTVAVADGVAEFTDLGLEGRVGVTYELRYVLDGTGIEATQELRIPVPAAPPPASPVHDDDGQLPSPAPGSAELLVDGAPVAVTVEPTDTGVRVTGGDVELHAAPADLPLAVDRGILHLLATGSVEVQGSGFRPSSRVAVWLFSEPTLLGEVTVASTGDFEAVLSLLPSEATSCNHTLQLVGQSHTGAPVAVSLGVEVLPDPFPFGDVAQTSEHAAAIGCAAERGWVQGRTDDTFAPGASITRAQAAALLARALDLPSGAVEGGRDGVTGAHAEAIAAVLDAGLMRGYPDGDFRGGARLTRGQAASVFAAALRLPSAGEDTSYLDIAGTAHAPAIAALEGVGIIEGFADGRFRPADPISRAQFTAMLARAMRAKPQA